MARETRHNVIVTPKLEKRINEENKILLKDFINYLRSLQRSETTIAAYENDIKISFCWNVEYNYNKPFVNWTKRNVVAFQDWLLNENGNSPARVRRLKASLSSLSNFICNVLDDEYPNFKNIITKVESPLNVPVREKTVFTEEQIDELLHILSERGRHDQACAVALALYSGRRKSELLRFKVTDFDEAHLVCDGALYKSDPIKTKGRGVNGKMLECFTLANKFKPYFDAWMERRKEKGIESIWLFPSLTNPEEPCNTSTLDSWAEKFGKIMDENFYWHAMRHMTVTNFKRAGIPDTVIQQYIGWSDLSMIPIYSDLKADEQLSMYFTANGIEAPKPKSLAEL